MVELTKDNRKVVKTQEGKFIFQLEQEQVYDAVTVENMIKKWKEQKAQYETFLINFDNTMKQAHDRMTQELNAQKEKVLKEIENIDEGLMLWENPSEGG